MKYLFLLFLINLYIVFELKAVSSSELVNITKIETESVTLQLADESNSNDDLLLILRAAEFTSVSPKLNQKYTTNNSYNTSDSSSFSGKGNLIVYQEGSSSELVISNLKSDTYYYIDIYKKEKKQFSNLSSINFTTLALPPQKQVQRIMWKGQTTNSFDIVSAGAISQSILICLSKSQNDFVPVNGTAYKSDSAFGKGQQVADGTFIVLSEKDSVNSVQITNLLPGADYYIKAFAYNGKGKSCNYLTETTKLKNYIKLSTLMEAPKLLKFQNSESGGCFVEWSEVKGVQSYVVELAFDKDFNSPHEIYDKVDVGVVNRLSFIELTQNTEYFVRVRAFGESSGSEYSNVLSIKL
jgi:hypothetical protein